MFKFKPYKYKEQLDKLIKDKDLISFYTGYSKGRKRGRIETFTFLTIIYIIVLMLIF